MKQVNLKQFSEIKLLRLLSGIVEELKNRKIVRTHNNPIADYAEWLAAKKLKLSLETSSHKGFDAKDRKGRTYQIKCRRLTNKNKSKQLGVIRNLNKREFDFLIGIIFNEQFDVIEAYMLPRKIISQFAVWSKHQNGHILQLKGPMLKSKYVKNITARLNP